MRYWKYLKEKDKSICPFCILKKEEILDQNQDFFVIVCRSPYSKDHFMIVPKRHIIFLDEMTAKEYSNFWKIIRKRNAKLHEFHENVWMMLRDSTASVKHWKTIDHLHFHLIPDCIIGALWKRNASTREYFEEDKYFEMIEKTRKKYL